MMFGGRCGADQRAATGFRVAVVGVSHLNPHYATVLFRSLAFMVGFRRGPFSSMVRRGLC